MYYHRSIYTLRVVGLQVTSHVLQVTGQARALAIVCYATAMRVEDFMRFPRIVDLRRCAFYHIFLKKSSNFQIKTSHVNFEKFKGHGFEPTTST